MRRRVCEVLGGRGERLIGVFPELRGDVALELGAAKVGEERLLTRGQLVGLLAQRAQPLLDAHLLGGRRLHACGLVRGNQHRATIAAASASARAQDIAHNRAIKGRNRQSSRMSHSSFVIPYYHSSVRAVAIDFGGRRVGLAVSDASRTLARPLETLTRPHGSGDTQVVAAVLDAVEKLERDADPVDTLVVGVPRRLDGSPNEQTPKAEQFVAALRAATTRTVVGAGRAAHQPRGRPAAGAPRARLEETQGPPRRRRSRRHPAGVPR